MVQEEGSDAVLKTLSSGHAQIYLVKPGNTHLQSSDTAPVVCKRVETFSLLPPHNVHREIQFLKRLDHPNLVHLLWAEEVQPVFKLYMPYYPICLAALLDDPQFTCTGSAENEHDSSFWLTAQHLGRQMCLAVDYLHEQNLAHRDLNPRNFVLGLDAHLKLIDLGIALDVPEPDQANRNPTESVCFDVGTGPYKAPELLFAYAPHALKALDLWSLGATLAEFFTPVQELKQEEQYDQGEESVSSSIMPPWAMTLQAHLNHAKKAYKRRHVFSDEHGEIGLAASIFKILGTPTAETWPESQDMPVFQNCGFVKFEGGQLDEQLGHLQSTNKPALDVITSLLRISASQRATAKQATESTWLQPLDEAQIQQVGQTLKAHHRRAQEVAED